MIASTCCWRSRDPSPARDQEQTPHELTRPHPEHSRWNRPGSSALNDVRTTPGCSALEVTDAARSVRGRRPVRKDWGMVPDLRARDRRRQSDSLALSTVKDSVTTSGMGQTSVALNGRNGETQEGESKAGSPWSASSDGTVVHAVLVANEEPVRPRRLGISSLATMSARPRVNPVAEHSSA